MLNLARAHTMHISEDGKVVYRHTRLTRQGHAPQDGESWKANGVDLAAVAIVTGQAAQDELRYLKSASMQLWLLGYELTGKPHLTAGSPAAFVLLPLPRLNERLSRLIASSPIRPCHVSASTAFCTCIRRYNTVQIALLWLAETVLVFTKEAFHVLTSAGKKGA